MRARSTARGAFGIVQHLELDEQAGESLFDLNKVAGRGRHGAGKWLETVPGVDLQLTLIARGLARVGPSP